MDIETVTQDIEQWIVNFVEVPHTALGGWPPCPYARSARMKKSYDIRIGMDPYFDLRNQARWGMGKWEVIIYVYNPVACPVELFAATIKNVNIEHLLKANMIALEDHPSDVEMVNGVCMNQGTYALAMVQSLSELNAKSETLARQNYYHDWPEEYLTALFQHRRDPQ